MQSTSNRLIIASAGSGKTTFLVDEAIARPGKKIAMLTYTNNNLREIEKKFWERHGEVPNRVDVVTWFSFLLHECARPYQRSVYPKRRVRTIDYPKGRSARCTDHSDTERFYFRNSDEIYSDKISRFIIDCEKGSSGLVTKRLADIYDEIYIDEFQDLSGYDLDLVEVFLRARIRVLMVGDPRQCTYTTNNSARNSQYRGMGILNLARQWEARNICQIESHARSHRCNQKICNFADALWPDMEKTISLNETVTDHDGVFVVSTDDLEEYARTLSTVILRYDRRTETYGHTALNFGNVKGMTFERVLIIPHGPIRRYLQSADVNDVKGSIEKFYVAVTRAKHSVAFLHDGECRVACTRWPSHRSER